MQSIRLSVIALAALAAILPTPSRWVETMYARGLYSELQARLTPLSNSAPVAFFDLLLAAALVWLGLIWLHALRPKVAGMRVRAVGRAAIHTVFIFSLAYLTFLLCWGLNYRREPLSTRLDFDKARVTRDRLMALGRDSIRELNSLSAQVDAVQWPPLDEVGQTLKPGADVAYRQLLGQQVPAPGRPKRSFLNRYFERAGVDGMIDPFLLEIIVNHEVLPVERPFVVAHEWAHLAGHADEAEANFLGWITCLQSGPPARYSAWLFLYRHVAGNLSRPERDAMARALSPHVRRDLDAIAARARRASPILRRASSRAYDRFLKANRVALGVASYDAVVELVLGTRFEPEWKPRVAARAR